MITTASNSDSDKSLAECDDVTMMLLSSHSSTGLGFYIVEDKGNKYRFYAVLEDGKALPLFIGSGFYDLGDLLNGSPIPNKRMPLSIQKPNASSNRAVALNSLNQAIAPKYAKYLGGAGAFPLILTQSLQAKTRFVRYACSPVDQRFSGGHLSPGTYMTSSIDAAHANTGLRVVGRYALPVPLPACHVFEYDVPAGTQISIGTVAPMFGQSGGGVEVRLKNLTGATQINMRTLPKY